MMRRGMGLGGGMLGMVAFMVFLFVLPQLIASLGEVVLDIADRGWPYFLGGFILWLIAYRQYRRSRRLNG
jgi:hypothetical protein